MSEATPRVYQADRSFHRLLDERSLDLCFGPHDVRECGEPRGSADGPGVVSGPFDCWHLRHLRERAGLPGADAIGTDLFLWSLGTPSHPAVTRLGGVPYLPRDRAWPRRNGVVGTFYAQLNFADSRDLVPFAPSDVLLVFHYRTSACSSWDRAYYEFVWVDVDDRAPLHRQADVPPGGLDDAAQLFGVRVRSFDEPALVGRIRRDGLPHVHVVHGTKAGGAPSDRQSIDPPATPPDWRFLGQIAATWPPNDVPHPVLGHPEKVRYGTAAFHRLVHGPGDGITCLYLDAAGQVQLFFSCA